MKTLPRLLLPAAAMTLAASSFAATWTGATNGSWATTTNWSDNSAPNGTVTYDASSANLTETLDGSASITGITVGAVTGAVTLNAGTGGTLTLGTGGVDMSAAAQNLTINSGLTFGGNSNLNVASGRSLTFGATGQTTTFNTGTTTTITGAGTTFITGSGTVTGAGEIVVSNGTLRNNLQGGTVTRTGATTLSSGGTIIISSSLNMFGTGALNLNGGAIGSFSTTGRDLGTGNAVTVGGDFAVGSGTGLSTGYVRFGGATDLGGAVRTITSGATGILTNNGAGAIFTGIVSNGGLTKAGTGYITLTNDGNTFTGATTVNAGFLAISQKALANSASVTVASGANLVIGANGAGTHDINNLSGGATAIIRSDFSLSGTNTTRQLKVTQTVDGTYSGNFTEGSSRAISLIKEGAANLTLDGTGTRYTNGTTVNAGTLTAGAVGALGTGAIGVNGGTLASSVANVNVGALTVGGGALALNGSGAGTLTLTAGQNFTFTSGQWNIDLANGTDQVIGSGAGVFSITGGTLDLGGGAINYGASYNLISGFASGSVAGLSITGYNTTNWIASLDNAGALSFTAVPEPSTYGLVGAGALAAVAFVRRRRKQVA